MKNLGIKSSLIVCTCLLIAAFLLVRQGIITYQDTVQYGGIDLRNRIVGTRLLQQHLDPYFTKWQPGMSERLCDPDDVLNRPVNRNTVTPFLLWLQQPLASLHYKEIRLAWWAIQQLLLFSIITFFSIYYRRSLASVCIVLISAAIFCNTTFWLYHSERGQVYILYAVWACGLFALWQSRYKYVWLLTGGWLAIGFLLRPLLMTFFLPAFIAVPTGKKGWLILSTIAFSSILVAVSHTWQTWHSYSASMHIFTQAELQGIYYTTRQAAPYIPTVIEGMANASAHKNHPDINFLLSLNKYAQELGHRPPFIFYLACFAAFLLFVLALLYKLYQWKMSPVQLLALGTLLYVCAEACLPYRNPYNLSMWLPCLLAATGYCFSLVQLQSNCKKNV